jgi:hypothetical protein
MFVTIKFCSSSSPCVYLSGGVPSLAAGEALKCFRASGWEWEQRLFFIFYLLLSTATWIFNKELGLICVRGVENSQYEFLKASASAGASSAFVATELLQRGLHVAWFMKTRGRAVSGTSGRKFLYILPAMRVIYLAMRNCRWYCNGKCRKMTENLPLCFAN